MTKKQPLSNQDFLMQVREYLPMDASTWEVNGDGKPVGSGLVGDLCENCFYLFDSETLLAVSHAIEDMALEEAKGKLQAIVQDFKQFAPYRERYWQLAATLDDVQIIGTGRTPRGDGEYKFRHAGRTCLGGFWAVIYRGRRNHLMVIAEQVNRARQFEDKRFTGFYTLDHDLVSLFAGQVIDALNGRVTDLTEFRRLQTIDRAVKQIHDDMTREKELIDDAIHRLQCGGKYGPRQFAADFDRALNRLQQWKARLPEMLAAHQK